MFEYQVSRKVWGLVVAAGLLSAAGCSNQPTQQATKTPAKAVAKAPAKPAPAAKPANAPAKPQSASSANKTAVASAKPVSASSKVAPTSNTITVPKGTAISAKIGQALASNKNHAGDSFTATVASSVKVNGKTIIPKGAQLTGHVVAVKKKKPAELTVALASVQIHGKSYPLATNSVGPAAPASSQADDSDAAQKKDVTVAADTRMKFKLTKSVKIPVKG